MDWWQRYLLDFGLWRVEGRRLKTSLRAERSVAWQSSRVGFAFGVRRSLDGLRASRGMTGMEDYVTGLWIATVAALRRTSQ
ncbi:MAG: hypothetical protein NC218_06340 [Acetobacter sp.]|nr:hypothetical protein [Acetobacter sp.]